MKILELFCLAILIAFGGRSKYRSPDASNRQFLADIYGW